MRVGSESISTSMFKIGDFSKLSRVSVKALHYYDEVGLLKPMTVDRFTGYRYYSFEQLPRLNRILALKDLGFSLEQIGRVLDADLSLEELHGMLRLRQAELQQQVEATQERLNRIGARLRQIEQEGKMLEHEIVLKQVEAVKVAAARELVPTAEPLKIRERCQALCTEVCDLLAQKQCKESGPWLAVYRDSSGQGLDVEMAVFVEAEAAARLGRAEVYELPAVETMASAIYQGSYDAFEAVSAVYVAMGKWIEANGYRVVGPSREIYLQTPNANTPNGTMEIQFPVEKA